MTLPNMGDLEGKCATLEKLASQFAETSPEHDAISAAAHAMRFVSHLETQEKFRSWVASWTEPPTALQVLQAKLAGIEDLPHELMDDSMLEVERLMERLRQQRT